MAILGRPNVGKSTLFNALIGRRRSITHSQPGVTRDPVEAECTLGGLSLLLVDTGGFAPSGEAIDGVVAERSLATARDSDLIILVLDAAETTPEDEEFMSKLRPFADKLLLVVNKVDTPDRDSLVWNAHAHGFPRVIGVSAAHGREPAGAEGARLPFSSRNRRLRPGKTAEDDNGRMMMPFGLRSWASPTRESRAWPTA